jgi:Peptidase A4 family
MSQENALSRVNLSDMKEARKGEPLMMNRVKVLRSVPRVTALAAGLITVLGGGVPTLPGHAEQPVAPHVPPKAWQMAPKIRGRNGASTNWSGYAVTGTNFTDVKGRWTVPAVGSNPPGVTNAYSSMWVGIDGDNSNTVEQCGTEQDNLNGTPRYYAWYEMYPKGSVVLNTTRYPVARGDSIDAEVQSGNRGAFTLSMHSSRGWNFSTTQKLNQARRTSAEWIAEAPWWGGVLPLADFGSVLFSNCTATIGTGSSVGLFHWPSSQDQITMVSSDGTHAKATPGQVASDSSFSITWNSAQ